MSTLPVKDIYVLGGGLNIEGGFPLRDLKKTHTSNPRWVNHVVVLDRPLVDNIVFDDLLANNKFPLLENALEDLNEHQFLAVYLMIIAYYIDNGRKFIKLLPDEKLKITIYVHQDVTCLPLINIIKTQMDDMIKFYKFDMTNIEFDFRSDIGTYQMNDMMAIYQMDNKTNTEKYIKSKRNYEGTHILISLSQCAGLDPNLPAGAMIIPTEFIPYDIDSSTIFLHQKYMVDNDLTSELDNILKSDYHKYAVDYINNKYLSFNPLKNNRHMATELSKKDFVATPILQVNKLWNPKNPEEIVYIKD